MPFLFGRSAAPGRDPLALATADQQAHVVAVSLTSGRIRRRIATRPDPRSIEHHGAGPVVVAHSGEGVVSLIDPRELRVRRVLTGFVQPRYTAIGLGGDTAYVTDSGTGELAVIDLVSGRVVRRIDVGDRARHLTRSPDGRSLWIALGSSAAEITIVDIADRWHPTVHRRLRPAFLAHDVGFSPGGRRVWVTAGREPRMAIYAINGHVPLRTLPADAAPQHVTFTATSAYIASGNGATVTVRALSDDAVRRTVPVPIGSYNIQSGAHHVLTPSLQDGALTILTPTGRVVARVQVATAAHDVCVVA